MTNHEMKSKVMSLGNKLAANSADRSSAFVRAWAIVKAGGLELNIKGVTFGKRQEALKRLAPYDPSQVRAVLVPEPENKADPAALAVRVGVQGGRGLFTLGYVPKELTAIVAAIGARLPALRVVSGAWGRGKTTFGACIALAV